VKAGGVVAQLALQDAAGRGLAHGQLALYAGQGARGGWDLHLQVH
jgi:hypothetical protein